MGTVVKSARRIPNVSCIRRGEVSKKPVIIGSSDPIPVGVVAVGLPGATGAAGGTISVLAADICCGHRVVCCSLGSIRHACSNEPDHAGSVIGITKNAANPGEGLVIVTSGIMDEPSWSFTPGAVFVGLDGSLVQEPPQTGFVQQVGVAVSATRLIVSLGPVINLSP